VCGSCSLRSKKNERVGIIDEIRKENVKKQRSGRYKCKIEV
jgi:hypothetical protein